MNTETIKYQKGDRISIPDEKGNLEYGTIEEEHSYYINNDTIYLEYIIILDNGRRGAWSREDGLRKVGET